MAHVFGGTPTPQQQADFANQVLHDLQQTFQLSGLTPKLTLDPNVPAAHTFSTAPPSARLATAQSLVGNSAGKAYAGKHEAGDLRERVTRLLRL